MGATYAYTRLTSHVQLNASNGSKSQIYILYSLQTRDHHQENTQCLLTPSIYECLTRTTLSCKARQLIVLAILTSNQPHREAVAQLLFWVWGGLNRSCATLICNNYDSHQSNVFASADHNRASAVCSKRDACVHQTRKRVSATKSG